MKTMECFSLSSGFTNSRVGISVTYHVVLGGHLFGNEDPKGLLFVAVIELHVFAGPEAGLLTLLGASAGGVGEETQGADPELVEVLLHVIDVVVELDHLVLDLVQFLVEEHVFLGLLLFLLLAVAATAGLVLFEDIVESGESASLGDGVFG